MSLIVAGRSGFRRNSLGRAHNYRWPDVFILDKKQGICYNL